MSQIFYFTLLTWVLTWVSTGLKSRCLQDCVPLWKLQGRACSLGLLVELSCLSSQDWAPCILAVCSRPFSASGGLQHSLWPCLSIFRVSNGDWTLLVLQIPPNLVCDPAGKVLLCWRTHVITPDPPSCSQITFSPQGPYSTST